MKIDDKISGKTKLLGLIGNPVEHSFSPQLHNTISGQMDNGYIYVPFRVEKGDLENAIRGLKAINVLGFNVTVPYKRDVIKYLDHNSKEVLLMGTVNTVKNIDGKLYGYNTDAQGFSRSFREEAGTGFENKNVVVLGAGGAARAIIMKIAMEGAQKIYIINRTVSKATDIAELVNNNISTVAEAYGSDNVCVKDIFESADVIVNTTSAGMYPDIDCSPIDSNIGFHERQIVYDAIYNPQKTKMLSNAQGSGCRIINGLGMLFYQAIYAYEVWTGTKLPNSLTSQLYDSFRNYFFHK